LLAAVRAEARAGSLVRSRRRWRVVGAVAAATVLALVGVAGRESRRAELAAAQLTELSSDYATLERRLAEQGHRLVSLEDALATQTQIMRILDGPQLRAASLAPSEGRAGRGRVLLDVASGEAAVVLTDVPALAPGQTYELWAIRGNKAPEPAGLLGPAAGTRTALRVAPIPAAGEVSAFAVSIEPAAGSPSPTGPVVLVGAVG
jgi:anti-sigma-K factor RskA